MMLNEDQMSELRAFIVLQLKQDIIEFAAMADRNQALTRALKALSRDMDDLDQILFGDGDKAAIDAAWERYRDSRHKDPDPTGHHRRRGAADRRAAERRSNGRRRTMRVEQPSHD